MRERAMKIERDRIKERDTKNDKNEKNTVS